MKKLLLCAAFIAASFTSIAQVGVGTLTPDTSAALEVKSTTKGFLPPRMTTAERDLINSGVWAEGLTIYNTVTKCLELYNGTDWISVCDGSVVTTPPTTQVASDNSGGTYTFLSHNLGANTLLDPDIPVVGLQGAYIQWGKRGPTDFVGAANDGSSGFAAAPTDSAANDAAISGWSQTTAADSSWNSNTEANPVKVTANDPCPIGYRVPTRTEWEAVDNNNTASRTGTFTSGTTEYGSALHYGPDASTKLLTLPAAGFRNATDGALNLRGYYGLYWSSTEDGSNAYNLTFTSSNVHPANANVNRTLGLSVRCIAE